MTQLTLKKSAYAAIGVPIHMMANLRERLTAARDAFEEMRDRVADEAADTFDQWADEGEKLFASIEQRFTERRDEIEEDITTRAATMADVGKGLAETFTEPLIPIDEIDGIGPSYAAKLAKAGVISTAALVERCRTHESLGRLASQTGISETLLRKWAASADLTRVKGVGDDYMTMLNSLRIGTLSDLAAAKPEQLRDMAAALQDKARDPLAVPSQDTFRRWTAAAGKLV